MSVGLLWMRDRPVSDTSTWQHTTITIDIYPCHPEEFEPATPSSEPRQTHALHRAATVIGFLFTYLLYLFVVKSVCRSVRTSFKFERISTKANPVTCVQVRHTHTHTNLTFILTVLTNRWTLTIVV